MFTKTVFVICLQALLIQSALSQVCGRSAFGAAQGFGSYGLTAPALSSPFGYNGLGTGFSGNSLACNGLASNSLAYDSIYSPAVEITPTSGGALPVTSASAIAPNSLVVASENVYEGTLAVDGELPFVGTVGLEGVLPTAGSGAVNHACGNGATRVISQDGAAVASGFGAGYGPAAALATGNVFNGVGALGNTPFGYGTGLAGLNYPAAGYSGAYPATGCGAGLAPYGGAGEGNVAVAGELPVAGNTAVAGQVPIMGAVRFGGDLPAAGTVAISGKCACGCGNRYVY